MSGALPESNACYNCGALLHGRFCAACGQEAQPLNPRLRDAARDLAQELLDIDGRFIGSVRRLFLSPGFLTREQFEGRRIGWLSPLRLYLTFSVAYFAISAFVGSFTHLKVTTTGEDADAAAALQKMGYQSSEDLRQAIGHAQAVWMPRVMFVLVPVFAGLVQLVRRRQGRTYPQHLQFALHAYAAWFGARAVAAAAPLLKSSWLTQTLDALTLLYGIVYVVIALQVVYGGTRRRAALDAAIILGVYGVAALGATLAIILPFIYGR